MSRKLNPLLFVMGQNSSIAPQVATCYMIGVPSLFMRNRT